MMNHLGKLSFFCGVAIVVFDLGFGVVRSMILGSGDFSAVGALNLGRVVIAGVLAIAAIVSGIVSLTRPGLRRGFAAAGTAMGGMTVVGIMSGLASSALLDLMSR